MVFLTVVTLVPLAVRDRYGRNGFQVLLPRLASARAARTGSDLYRSGPLSRMPAGHCRLPGSPRASTALDALDAWGRPFAVLSHPHVGHVTAVIAAASDGAALVDAAEVDNRVAHWGAWLADLGHEPGLVAASVTIESAPDTGTRLRHEVEHNVDPGSPEARPRRARLDHRHLPDGVCGHGLLHHAHLVDGSSGGLRASAAARRRWRSTSASGSRASPERLGATGAGAARPMTTASWPRAVASPTTPPPSAPSSSPPRQLRMPGGIAWADAGPAAAQEGWDHYRHDSGVSASWFMAKAPAGHVFSNTLAQLLAPHPDIARKRVTLVYRPHDPASAAKTVERDRLDAQFAASGKKFGRARDAISKTAADKSAEEEAQGAGLVRFGLIATATVMAGSDLDLAGVAMENMGNASRITLRPAYGCQASAFAATLPLGHQAAQPPPRAPGRPGDAVIGNARLERPGRPRPGLPPPAMPPLPGSRPGASPAGAGAEPPMSRPHRSGGRRPGRSVGCGRSSPARARRWSACRSAATCARTPRCAATRSAGSPGPGSSPTRRCSCSASPASASRA